MMFNPFLKYTYKLNGEPITGIALGSSISHKAEESLDEGGFNLPISVKGIEYEMNGTLEIQVTDRKGNVENFTYLIIYDEVDRTSPYGWFTHSLRVIEYTHKLNNYFIDTLIVTQPFFRSNINARFEIPFNSLIKAVPGTPDIGDFLGALPYIKISDAYYSNEDIVFESVGSITVLDPSVTPSYSATKELFISVNGGTKKNISTGNVTIQLDEGINTIEYGVYGLYDQISGNHIDQVIYKFYVNGFPKENETLYDVINKLRNIKPFETKYYHPNTRIFNIDENKVINGFTLKEILEKTPSPQFFIQKATMFQVLSGIFKYINSIPRLLRNGNGIDNLTRDDFNEITGEFSLSGMYDYTSSQDVQLYGTRGISPLERTLPNELNKPNVETPANNFFKTIRARDVQLTETNNGFEIQLEKRIYQLNKVEVLIPEIKRVSQGAFGAEETITNLVLDITSRVLNRDEWLLKNNTVNYPTPILYGLFREEVGLRNNKVENIYYIQGENSIMISQFEGDLIRTSLLENTIKSALWEYFSYQGHDIPDGFPNTTDQDSWVYTLTIPSVLDIKFNVEYITLQDFNVAQEREDRSIINRFSELALKQSDKQINVELASRKSYGEIQRGSLPNYSFSMIHNYLDELLPVFYVDSDGYVIIERNITFYNTYLDVVYNATKDHNRLQEFIGVNQEYRPFEIPTSNKIYDRKEYYTDYVFIVPSSQDISFTLTRNLLSKKFYRQLVSNLQNDKTYSKNTFALVYTDGFGKEYSNIPPYNFFRVFMTPTVVVGAKQSLVFTVGFDSNQIVGNSLQEFVENVGGNNITTTYNKPIRYTDDFGRLNEFWMALFNSIEDIEDVLDPDTYDYNDYPLTQEIAIDSIAFMNIMGNSIANNGTLMRTQPLQDEGEYNPFIVQKDSHENLTIQYNVSIMSYNYKQFVVGHRFTSFNSLVNNELDDLYIYIYDDMVQYGIFNDQLIKSMDSATKVLLSQDNVAISDIDYGTKRFGVKVEFVGSLKTLVDSGANWVIGDNEGNLYLACNENITSFDFLGTHQDIRVKEIGKDHIIYNAYIYMVDTIVGHVVEPVSYGETISVRTFDYVSKKYDYQRFALEILLEDSVSGYLIEPISYSNNIMATTTFDSQGNENLFANLLVNINDDILFEIVNPIMYNENIYTNVIYSGQGIDPLISNLSIDIQETLSGELVSSNTLNEVINTFIAYSGDSEEQPTTIAPTVGTPYCVIDGAFNSYRVLISNNENMSVTIRNGSVVLGTMTALETSKEFIFDSGYPTPYNYNINITAQASGLQPSTNVNRSGTIILCSLQ